MSKESSTLTRRVIPLKQAIAEIKRAVQESDAAGPRAVHSPFFFIVGAGISHPPIPLAKDIEQRCRQEIAKSSPDGFMPLEEGSPAERYAACMEAAFPNAEQRRAFLHELMRSARLSAANLRLAHLLGAGHLTNLVFTPNFDEMLSQALRFLGHPVIVCDHPAMTGRLDLLRDEIQIVHVHGTHWFYDLRNLPNELKKAGNRNRTTSLSLPEFLDHVVHHRSPLVVGYSGWDGDVLMSSLKKRLKHELGSNLYWFCYRRSGLDALPGWLKDNRDVRFVVSDDTGPRGPALQLAESGLGSEAGEPVLPAWRVFEAMSVALELKAPEISRDPLGFLMEYLDRHLDPSVGSGDSAADPFLISSTLARVKRAADREREAEQRQKNKTRQADARLDEALDAVRSSDYAAALAAALKLDLGALLPERRSELEEALERIYLGTKDLSPELGLAACEKRVALSEAVLAEFSSLGWRTSHAKALHGKGYCLSKTGRLEEALSFYQAIIEVYGETQEPNLQERVAKAFVNKGIVLDKLGKPDEALAAYQELFQRFGDSDSPAVQEPIGRALCNKGIVLGQLSKFEEALAAYQELFQRFGDSDSPTVQEEIAGALLNKGVVLGQLSKFDEELAAYQELFQRFGDSDSPAVQEQIAGALLNKGVVLGQLSKFDEELAACQELFQRFGDSDSPAVQERIAKALYNKGFALDQLGKPEEAQASRQELIRRFGASDVPAIREVVGLVH